MLRHGPADTIACLLVSGSVVRAQLYCGGRAVPACEGKEASERLGTRLSANGRVDIYSAGPWARLMQTVTWAFWWMGFWRTVSGGRKLLPIRARDRGESISQHIRGWITHVNHLRGRRNVSMEPPDSSPALSPDQIWLSPTLFLAAIPLVLNSLLLLRGRFLRGLLNKKEMMIQSEL